MIGRLEELAGELKYAVDGGAGAGGADAGRAGLAAGHGPAALPTKLRRTTFRGQTRHGVAGQIVKRWKYRACSGKNRFLGRRSPLFRNVAAELSVKSSHVLNLDRVLSNYRGFMEATRLLDVHWDLLLNPLVLVSEGWAFYGLSERVLRCLCGECHKMLSVELDSADTGHMLERGILKLGHSTQCYWKTHSYPLSRDYHLNKTTMLQEYLRMSKPALAHETIRFEVYLDAPLDRIRPVVGVEDSNLLKLLLRGFDLSLLNASEGVVTCKYCAHKSHVESLAKAKYNGHFLWCRYHDQTKLATLILDDLEKHEATTQHEANIENRLSRLENLLMKLEE
ncbi:hypothetical protein RNJ44_00055 [Nakaseomyces bracarensis]|uniref:Uncharacterized protein n=1 Tax=Nakaseomyces bracarensis TaxID=273131 RepID=A0ABR4P0Z0_9SACH